MNTISTNTPTINQSNQLERTDSRLNNDQLLQGQTLSRPQDNGTSSASDTVDRITGAELTHIAAAVQNSTRANNFLATADAALAETEALLQELHGLVTTTPESGEMDVAGAQAQMDESVSSIAQLSGSESTERMPTLEQIFDSLKNGTPLEFHMEIISPDELGKSAGGEALVSLTGEGLADKISSGEASAILGAAKSEVSAARARVGELQSAVTANVNELTGQHERLSGANAHIGDTDFARETANLAREQILIQAGTSVRSLANSRPQNVLSLLG